MDQVKLRLAPEGWACVRELSGHEEQAVSGAGLVDALRLLDAVLLDVPGGALAPGRSRTLAAPDRDRLLAAVYVRAYGPRVEGTLRCVACEERFDLDFRLPDLIASLDAPSPDAPRVTAEGGGVFRLEDGVRFRFPTGEEEHAALALPAEEAERALLRAALVGAGIPEEREAEVAAAVQAGMEAVAAVIDTDLVATCPECGHGQEVRFDLQSYLLRRLAGERPRLAHEIHRLASAYRWSLREILDLPRSRRRALVELVEEEISGAGWRWR